MTLLKRGIIKSYDATAHRASVQMAGSLSVWLDGLAVATDISAGEVIPGRQCTVLLFTDDNPDDAVIITVHGAVPGGGGGAGGSGGTLDQAYDFGGPGAGRTIFATDGAISVQDADGDANPNLELTRASTTLPALGIGVAGEANYRFRARTDGRLEWGAGGAGAADTFLERASAAVLGIPGSLSTLRVDQVEGYTASPARVHLSRGAFVEKLTQWKSSTAGVVANSITADTAYVLVDTGGGAQVLNTVGVTGGYVFEGDVILLGKTDDANSVTLTHNPAGGAGTFRCIGGANIVLASSQDFAFLIRRGSVWLAGTFQGGTAGKYAHSALTGLTAGDDHSQYLLLAGRGGQTVSDSLGVGTVAPYANVYLAVGNQGSVNSTTGLVVDVGGSSGAGTNTVTGLAGRAIGRDASTTLAFGLDYLAGANGQSLTEADAIRAASIMQGAGKTITDFYGLRVRPGTLLSGAITNNYGVRVDAMTIGSTLRCPFYDAGTTASGDNRGNVFKSNTQFASTTMAFGGGAGVIGIANATTVPTTNPAGGVVLYAEAGQLKMRGAGGNIAILPDPAPSVTGSRGGNAALASLLTQLAALGHVVDNTTP